MSGSGLSIGTILPPALQTPDLIVQAERLGYDRAWVLDSPVLFADTWMTLALAAVRTERIRLGVAVITPAMRHLVANASAIATLDALAPGRVDVGVGAGFTSQLLIGKTTSVPWAEVEAYVTALRGLLAGSTVRWDDADIALMPATMTGIRLPAQVQFHIAAHGPKGLAVAIRVADGVITNAGHGEVDLSRLRLPARVQLNATVLDEGEGFDSERVRDAAGPAAALHLHLGAGGAAADLPEVAAYGEWLDTQRERDRLRLTHRGHLTEVTADERPYVTAELIRRTTATGTPAQIAKTLSDLREAGVDGVVYAPAGPDMLRELGTFARAAELTPSRQSQSALSEVGAV